MVYILICTPFGWLILLFPAEAALQQPSLRQVLKSSINLSLNVNWESSWGFGTQGKCLLKMLAALSVNASQICGCFYACYFGSSFISSFYLSCNAIKFASPYHHLWCSRIRKKYYAVIIFNGFKSKWAAGPFYILQIVSLDMVWLVKWTRGQRLSYWFPWWLFSFKWWPLN